MELGKPETRFIKASKLIEPKDKIFTLHFLTWKPTTSSQNAKSYLVVTFQLVYRKPLIKHALGSCFSARIKQRQKIKTTMHREPSKMKTAFAAFYVILSSILLAACGDSGGGSGSSSDTTPNTFSFTAETDAALSTQFTDSVTITGIDAAATVSITGGEYSTDGGTTYTSDEGTVTNNQDVIVRATSAASVSTDVDVVLTVGGVTGTFTITTLDDTTAPTVEIAFPPPASMTEGTEVLVRGTATDDYSDIATLQVNGVDVTDTSDDGSYSTWQIRAALTAGENTLTVTGSDSAGNEIAVGDQPSVAVRSDAAMGDFPDSVNLLENPYALVMDHERNRLLVSDSTPDRIYAVDMATGARTIFSDNTFEDLANPLLEVYDLLIDAENDVLWVADLGGQAVYSVNLLDGVRTLVSNNSVPVESAGIPIGTPPAVVFNPSDSEELVLAENNSLLFVNTVTGIRSVLSGDAVPDTDNQFGDIRGLVVDSVSGRYFVTDHPYRVLAVDPVTGARSLISSDTVPNSDEPNFGHMNMRNLAIDSSRSRLLVSDQGFFGIPQPQQIIAVEINTENEGVRSVLSSETVPDAINAPELVEDVYYDGSAGYAFWADLDLDAVLAVDIESGERVFVTRGDSAE